MSKRIQSVLAVVTLAVSVAATGAWAGAKVTETVTILSWSGGAGEALGTLGSARNSSDGLQYIQCALSTTGSTPQVFCSAQDSNGTWAGCTTTNANYVTVASTITTDSYVIFQWDGTGSCTSLQIESTSWAAPKQP